MRVSDKGQVTIPRYIRERLGIGPGSEVRFRLEDGRIIFERADVQDQDDDAFESWLEAVRGAGSGEMTTDEIMEMTRGPFDDIDPR